MSKPDCAHARVIPIGILVSETDSPRNQERPAPTPAPAAPIATSAIRPATGAPSAPVAFPIEPTFDLGEGGGSGFWATRGAADSSIETGCGLLACVAMGLR